MQLKDSEKGQTMIIIALMMISLISLMALVIDTGRIYIEHTKLQRGVDAAVLAGAQVLPDEAKARQISEEGAKLNKLEARDMDLIFTGPDKNGKNTVMATAVKTIDTRLAHFFNFFENKDDYSKWTISAQAIARNGPIKEIQHWLPIGIEDPAEKLVLYQHYRLTNTYHESANSSDIKLMYYPLSYGGNIKDGIRDNIAARTRIGTQFDPVKNGNIQDVCDGVDQRIRNRLGTVGCFKLGQTIDTNGLNIIGPGSIRDWHFGEDPRLVFIPFVKKDTNTGKLIVQGFGLFYIEYAHYDPSPPGSDNTPMTEIVGFFVKTVMEGPIENTAKNYGVIGIEYMDVNKFVLNP